jgi:hypothetical protein
MAKKKTAKTDDLYAFAFTTAAALGVVMQRDYEVSIVDKDVSSKDVNRFLKRKSDKKKVIFVDGAELVGPKKLIDPSVLRAVDVSIAVCDTIPKLEGRFKVVDVEKGPDGSYRPIRLTRLMVERVIAGETTDLGIADLSKPSIDVKIKRSGGGDFNTKGSEAGQKKTSLKKIVAEIAGLVDSAKRKTKLRNSLVKIAVGIKRLDDPEHKAYKAKIDKRAQKYGIEKAVWKDAVRKVTLLSESGLGKAYGLVTKNKKNVVAAAKIAGAREKDVNYAITALGAGDDK